MFDEILKNLSGVFTFLLASGVFLGGVGFAYEKIFKGRKEAKTDEVSSADNLITFWKERAEEYRTALEAHRTETNSKLTELTRQIGELQGQLKSEATTKKEYLAILQGRDPETKKFMEYMMKATEDHDKAHGEIMKVLGEIHKMTKAEADRELHITSTVVKDGI